MEIQSIKLKYCMSERDASGPNRPTGYTGHGHAHGNVPL